MLKNSGAFPSDPDTNENTYIAIKLNFWHKVGEGSSKGQVVKLIEEGQKKGKN